MLYNPTVLETISINLTAVNFAMKDVQHDHHQRLCGLNKKSELMLMRRARAYSSSCSQVILVYLHQFRHNSLSCSQKSLENPIFRVQGQSRSSMLTILKSPSPLLVMLSSISVPICNHFHIR